MSIKFGLTTNANFKLYLLAISSRRVCAFPILYSLQQTSAEENFYNKSTPYFLLFFINNTKLLYKSTILRTEILKPITSLLFQH